MILDLEQNPYDHELVKKMAEDNGFDCESLHSRHLEFRKILRDEQAEEPIGKVDGWRVYCRPPSSENYVLYSNTNYPNTSKVFKVTLGTYSNNLSSTSICT